MSSDGLVTPGSLTGGGWLLGTFLCTTLILGCVSTFERSDQSRLILPDTQDFETVQRIDSTPGLPLVTTTSMSTSFTLRRWKGIEFDGATLPLLNFSDGGRVAIQTGPPPSMAVRCALSGQCSSETGISIYRLGEDRETVLVHETEGGLLLGRNSNQTGFLVERPNRNGSRSIGIASWSGETIQWLVQDEHVNAFGWLAENGRLVYSSRPVDSTEFRLRVIEPDGSRWSIPEALPYSWIFPILSSCGKDLFAIRQGDGYADATYGALEDLISFRRSVSVRRMSDRVDLVRITQMMSTATAGMPEAESVLTWYSYELGRMVLWDAGSDEIQLLPEETVSAIPFGSKFNWLATTQDGLDRVTLFVTDTEVDRLIDFPWIARAKSGMQILLVEPRGKKAELALMEFTGSKP